ncbi:MAG: fumarylacetoacetate hydrolase family protein [Thermodesulfobacteriota bacterium]
MKLVRFLREGKKGYGFIEEGVVYGLDDGAFFRAAEDKPAKDDLGFGIDELKLLAPVMPSKIIALGLNYRAHAAEFNLAVPDEPLIFLKPSTSVAGPGDEIVYPSHMSRRVDYEGELAVVIARTAKDVTAPEAHKYILGYTCFNDVTARDLQGSDGQWTRAKSFDTFSPLGPWIETTLNASDVKIETFLNGELRQSSRTTDMIFNVFEIISFVSKVMTLLPGDVVATGTPPGVGRMKPGDSVAVSIEGIGSLENTVAAAAPSGG